MIAGKYTVPVKKFLRTILLFALYIGILIGSSCDESLPPRNNPKIIFKGDLSCYYFYTLKENDCKFFIDVKNIYSETIQDTAIVQGTIEVILKRDPRYHKTIQLSLQNLTGMYVYDPSTNLLTIDPGKEEVFSATWDFIDDNQVDFTTAIFAYSQDPNCPGRFISQTETFIVKGTIQIIRGGEIVPFGPKEFNTFSIIPSYIVSKICVGGGCCPYPWPPP
jgi:hypothetical protein